MLTKSETRTLYIYLLYSFFCKHDSLLTTTRMLWYYFLWCFYFIFNIYFLCVFFMRTKKRLILSVISFWVWFWDVSEIIGFSHKWKFIACIYSNIMQLTSKQFRHFYVGSKALCPNVIFFNVTTQRVSLNAQFSVLSSDTHLWAPGLLGLF